MTDQANGEQAQGAAAGAAGQAQGAAGQEQQGQQGQQPQGGDGAQQPANGALDLSAITDPAVRAAVEALQATVHRNAQEAARYRTERNAAREEAQKFQRQNETDQERQQREAQEATERLERLEQENRSLKVGGALQAAAAAAKAHNPARVAALLDGQVTLGDDGKPENIDALVAALQQSDPYLFQRTPGTADAGAGAGPAAAGAASGGINDMIRGRATARR